MGPRPANRRYVRFITLLGNEGQVEQRFELDTSGKLRRTTSCPAPAVTRISEPLIVPSMPLPDIKILRIWMAPVVRWKPSFAFPCVLWREPPPLMVLGVVQAAPRDTITDQYGVET